MITFQFHLYSRWLKINFISIAALVIFFQQLVFIAISLKRSDHSYISESELCIRIRKVPDTNAWSSQLLVLGAGYIGKPCWNKPHSPDFPHRTYHNKFPPQLCWLAVRLSLSPISSIKWWMILFVILTNEIDHIIIRLYTKLAVEVNFHQPDHFTQACEIW